MRMDRFGKSRFTLIELLVVIAIIAILAAMLLPALKSARERAAGSSCTGNIKQCNTALSLYRDAFDDFFPTANNNGSELNYLYWSSLIAQYANSAAVLECPTAGRQINSHPNNANLKIRTPDKVWHDNYVSMTQNSCVIVDVSSDSDAVAVKGVQIRNPSRVATLCCKFAGILDSGTDSGNRLNLGIYYSSLIPRRGGFNHNGIMNLGYVDGHVGQLRGKNDGSLTAQDTLQMFKENFYWDGQKRCGSAPNYPAI